MKTGAKIEGPAGPEKLAFSVSAGNSADTYNYLAPLVAMAKVDGGVTLPLVGKAGFLGFLFCLDVTRGARQLDERAQCSVKRGEQIKCALVEASGFLRT